MRHHRTRHTDYAFTHSVWYVEADLDDLHPSRSPRWSLTNSVLRRVRARDHLDASNVPLADAVRARLAAFTDEALQWQITLVTYPRTIGVLFNPVSFYLCRDADGALRHVIAEVNNTHRDRWVYDFPPEDRVDGYRSSAAKHMYVSPFIGAEARYDLRVIDDPERLMIEVIEYEGDEQTLYTQVNVQRFPLTGRRVGRLLLRQPLTSAKTIALIAWHALRLRRRGVHWERYRSPADEPPSTPDLEAATIGGDRNRDR